MYVRVPAGTHFYSVSLSPTIYLCNESKSFVIYKMSASSITLKLDAQIYDTKCGLYGSMGWHVIRPFRLAFIVFFRGN